MNIRDLITTVGAEYRADGLYNPGLGCGCGLQDLAPCGSMDPDCQLARSGIATEPGDIHETGDEVYFQINTKHAKGCAYYDQLEPGQCSCGETK